MSRFSIFLPIVLLAMVLPLKAGDHSETLSYEERVRCQRRIEEVYWSHRIWPAENPAPKPPLDAILPDSVIREKVETYLGKSAALELFWSWPLTGEQLQAEMERMARDTKNPDLLRELFAALDDDPLLIAECLARPVLVDRLARNWYARDTRYHGSIKQQAEDSAAFEAWWAEEGVAAIKAQADLDLHPVLPPVGGFHPASAQVEALATDTWTATSTGVNVPSARFVHTAVWTGAEMIVWGGSSLYTGGRYDPATDSWTPTSTAFGVPAGRGSHTAVWTGTEMIVWGGSDGSNFNSGGRYDPATDSWTPTSTGTGVPTARDSHTAVWSGTEMIVWGGSDGSYLNSGGRYDPVTDSWTPTSTAAGVPPGRALHTAVWTGTDMIVWSGDDGAFSNRGGRYDPVTDSWTPTSTAAGAPVGRQFHTAVWTGTEMIVWGGLASTNLNSGGRYDPATDNWTPTSMMAGVPTGRLAHTAVWTGTEMIVWGGVSFDGEWTNPISGGLYDPATNSWTATSTGAGVPLGRHSYASVWTGTDMIVWGGLSQNYGYLNDGGLYRACEGGSVATWYHDSDSDGYGVSSTGVPSCTQPTGYAAAGGDCAPDDPDIHPATAEINNGADDNCDTMVDEVAGVCGFHNPGDRDEFSWTWQSGATSYEVARCANPQFSSGCTTETTSATYVSDTEPVPPGVCHHYLVRSIAPYVGSWGSSFSGERTGICP